MRGFYFQFPTLNIDFSVSQVSVIFIKETRFLTGIKFVSSSEILPVMLRVLSVRTVKLLCLRLLCNTEHGTFLQGGA